MTPGPLRALPLLRHKTGSELILGPPLSAMALETDIISHKHSATLGQQLEALAAANADGLLELVLSFSLHKLTP